MTENTQAELDDILPPEVEAAAKTEVAEYTKTARELAVLEHRMRDVVYDVRTTKGLEAAKKDRAELRTLRVNLDKYRLELNADDQARIKTRNDEAKRITARIESLEDPIDQQIKAEEQRKEDEKAEKARKERARVDGLLQRIDTIKNIAARAVGKDSAYVREKIELVKSMTCDEFEEMTPSAVSARADTLATLAELLTAAEAHERAQADLKASQEREAAQRAENERLEAEARQQRAAQEEQARITREREQREEQERQAQARAAQERTTYITELVMDSVGASAQDIQHHLDLLRKLGRKADADAEFDSAEQRIASLLASRKTADELEAETRRLREESEARERQDREAREARERRAAEEAAELRQARLGEIEGIRHQVMIARAGRLGVRKGGTIECMRETLAETQNWTVTEEKFGELFLTADHMKKTVVMEIEAMIRQAEAEEQKRQEAADLSAAQAVAPQMLELLFETTFFCDLVATAKVPTLVKDKAVKLRQKIIDVAGDLRPVYGNDEEKAPADAQQSLA